MKASRYPVCIDPQNLAKPWITIYEETNNLKVLHFNDNGYVEQLKLAVTFGETVLIEDIEEQLDPILTDLLDGNFKRK